MKKILTVYTGGTICCAADGEKRGLSPVLAKRALLADFAASSSPFAHMTDDLFEDSMFDTKNQTLSENMTVEKLRCIINHIKTFDFDKYSGIIVMHGTDTLAFSASLFSFVFCCSKVPIMLVSGNRPPLDPLSNAGANFRTAVELILNGISPNVYVPYKNSDGNIYLHLGCRIMQCTNYCEDFFSAPERQGFLVQNGTLSQTDSKICTLISDAQNCHKFTDYNDAFIYDGVIAVNPYTGLDYSHISLDGIKAVVHVTYHSGTVCVERNCENEEYSSNSILYFADKCKNAGIPLFIVPSKLDGDQYSSVFDAVKNGGITPVNMTFESAYTKAIYGVSLGLCGDNLIDFMTGNICNEIL